MYEFNPDDHFSTAAGFKQMLSSVLQKDLSLWWSFGFIPDDALCCEADFITYYNLTPLKNSF